MKKHHEPKTCQNAQCGKTFTPYRAWQEYCSVECRSFFHKEQRITISVKEYDVLIAAQNRLALLETTTNSHAHTQPQQPSL